MLDVGMKVPGGLPGRCGDVGCGDEGARRVGVFMLGTADQLELVDIMMIAKII